MRDSGGGSFTPITLNLCARRLFVAFAAYASLGLAQDRVLDRAPPVQPRIEAAPNPVPTGPTIGSTTITWTTGDGTAGIVYVSKNGEAETEFASGSAGSSVANWIDGTSAYEFRLYSRAVPRVLLSTVAVRSAALRPLSGQAPSTVAPHRPVLTASPNPVPAGTGNGVTQISWDMGDGSPGRVTVSENGARETLFASGSSGTVRADWIRTGSQYEFRLYRDGSSGAALQSTTVLRRAAWPVPLVAALLIIIGAAVLIGHRWYVRGRVRTDRPEATADPEYSRRAYVFDLGITFGVAFCVWAKLVYAGRLMAELPASDPRMIGSASLATVLIVVGPLAALPTGWRLVPLLFIDMLVSVVLAADELFYRRYIDVLTTRDLASAPVLLEGFARNVCLLYTSDAADE